MIKGLFSPELKKELIRMLIGMVILGIIALIIFSLAGYLNLPAFLGLAAGCAFSYLNFLFMAFSVQQAVDKGASGATTYMSGTYSLRIILTAIFVIAVIKLPYFNYLAAVIPLVFPRIIIFALHIKERQDKK